MSSFSSRDIVLIVSNAFHLFFEGDADRRVEEILVLIWIEVLTKTAHLHQQHSDGGSGGVEVVVPRTLPFFLSIVVASCLLLCCSLLLDCFLALLMLMLLGHARVCVT